MTNCTRPLCRHSLTHNKKITQTSAIIEQRIKEVKKLVMENDTVYKCLLFHFCIYYHILSILYIYCIYIYLCIYMYKKSFPIITYHFTWLHIKTAKYSIHLLLHLRSGDSGGRRSKPSKMMLCGKINVVSTTWCGTPQPLHRCQGSAEEWHILA